MTWTPNPAVRVGHQDGVTLGCATRDSAIAARDATIAARDAENSALRIHELEAERLAGTAGDGD